MFQVSILLGESIIKKKAPNKEDLYIGRKFGELTVLRKLDSVLIQFTGRVETLWLCKCSCGQIMIEPTSFFSNQARCNCGCVRKRKRYQRATDWYSKHPRERLYGIWTDMKKRCSNKNCKGYKHYGGRGITVCDEWKNSYSSFREWAYKNGYDENAPKFKCTIDRIDNNGNYCPENCRWVDMKVQVSNRRPRELWGK